MIPPVSQPDNSSRTLCAALEGFADHLAARHFERFHDAGRHLAPGRTGRFDTTYEGALTTVFGWTEALEQVIRAKTSAPPDVDVLSAFGSVFDRACNLDREDPQELRALLAWIDRQSAAFPAGGPSPSLTGEIRCPRDILEALWAVVPGAGGKMTVESELLRQKLVNDGFPSRQPTVGGAAAIISGVLNRMGVRASFYSHYHSDTIAELFCEQARWLDLNHDDPLTPRPARTSGCATHPTRYGFALAYQKGTYADLLCCPAPLEAQKADRHLLVLRQPIGERKWDAWSVEGVPQEAPADSEWPVLTGFVRWNASGERLDVREAPDEWLAQLGARHAYVIVATPQPQEVNKPEIAGRLHKQLRLLHDAGATVHLEFNSLAQPGDDLAAFVAFGQDCLDSIGVNTDELSSYASVIDPKRWPPAGSRRNAAAPAPSERYEQAVALAFELGIDRLYVHGNDIDILLRRGADLAALEQERWADLFAKGAVLVATTLRNAYNLAQLRPPTEFPAEALEALAALRAHLAARPGARPADGGVEVRIAAASPEDYGVVAVPCIWYTESIMPRPFSSTGAGDITSGVALVYSGFRKLAARAPNGPQPC